MKFIPYPLYSNFSCIGYQKYLERIKIGNKYQFSGHFFLFNIFWLIRRKMYIETATFIVFMITLFYAILMFLNITTIGNDIKVNATPETISTLLTVFATIYTLISFLPLTFYHQNCLNKIDYNLKNPIEKLKPLNYISTIIIGFIMLISTIMITSLIIGYTIIFLS